MKNDAQDFGSLSGLAKRWLKTQLKFHGDPTKAAQDRREAEAIEYEARQRAEREAGRALVNAVLPPSWRERLQTFETQSERAREQRARDARSEHLARPRARVTFLFTGDIVGELLAEIPVEIAWSENDDAWVVISLEAVEPIEFSGHLFRGMRIALPVVDARNGTAVELARAVDRFEQSWDPLDAQIWLDSDESSFYWTAAEESPTFHPTPGLRSLEFDFPACDEMGRRVRLTGRIEIPAEAHG